MQIESRFSFDLTTDFQFMPSGNPKYFHIQNGNKAKSQRSVENQHGIVDRCRNKKKIIFATRFPESKRQSVNEESIVGPDTKTTKANAFFCYVHPVAKRSSNYCVTFNGNDSKR